MNVTISAFAAVLLVVVLHTILQHLLNWVTRVVGKDDPFMVLVLGGYIIEATIIVVLLSYILS